VWHKKPIETGTTARYASESAHSHRAVGREACRSLPEKLDIGGIFHTHLPEKGDTGGGYDESRPDVRVLRAIRDELEHIRRLQRHK